MLRVKTQSHNYKESVMAFDKVTTEDNGSTGFVKSNGVHKVELIRVGLNTRKNGSKGLSLTVKNPASEFADTLYDFGDTNYAATYTKADGSKAKMAPKYVNSLAAIVGATDDSTSMIFIDTKDGSKEVETFTDLNGTGVIIQVAVQMQYSEYYKEMKPTVVAVFNEDGLSATEINNGTTDGKQILLYRNIVDKGNAPTAPAQPTADEVAEANDIF